MSSRPSATRTGKFWRNDVRVAYWFLAPQILGFLAFVLGPLVAIIWFSLHNWNAVSGSFQFVGIGNYDKLFSDPLALQALWNTLLFALGIVPLNLVVALSLAILLNQRLRGTVALRTLFFTPVVMSLVAWSLIWQFILAQNGAVNAILAAFGVTGPNWLFQPVTAMGAIIVVQLFKNVGLNMLLFLAALQTVPADQTAAARIDGAGAISMFRHITLPYISPMILLVLVLNVIGSLQVFANIMVLTGGGPGYATTVLEYFFYKQAFVFGKFGYASAVAVLLFVIAIVLTALQWRARRRVVYLES